MSRRNEYLIALSQIRSGAWGGIAGGIVLAALAFLDTPPSTPMVAVGVILVVNAVWVWRAPTSKAVWPLFGGLLLVGGALLRDPGEPGRLAGSILLIGSAWRMASSYRRLSDDHLADALTEPPSPEELKEEKLEDLASRIHTSKMADHPRQVQFETADLRERLHWKGRLRSQDVVFVVEPSTQWAASTPSILTVAKGDFEIEAGRRTLFSRKREARFRIGDQRLKGLIAPDALQRYAHWKHIIVLIATCALISCGGSGGGSGNPNTPSIPEPTSAEWRELAAQLGSIAVGSVRQAVTATAAPGATPALRHPLLSAAGVDTTPWTTSTPLALGWSDSYFCCGSGIQTHVVAQGRIDVSVDAERTITVTETIQSASNATIWDMKGKTYNIILPSDGLKVTSRLVTRGEGLDPVQEFRIEGTLTYYSDNQGNSKTAKIDVHLKYQKFPDEETPVVSGDFGPERFTDSALPGSVATPTAPQVITSTHRGSFSQRLLVNITSGFTGTRLSACSEATQLTATVTMSLKYPGGGAVSGTALINGTEAFISDPCSEDTTRVINWNLPVSGTVGALAFSGRTDFTGGNATVTNIISFGGSMSGGRVAGLLGYSRNIGGANVRGAGTMSVPLTLQ